MALEAGSSDWAEAQSGDEYMDSLEPHWAVTNPGHLVDGKIKDTGRFTIRYCKGCSVGLCDECVDKEARRVYPRMIQIEARAAFFGLCKRAWRLNERMLDIEEPERWPLPFASAQEIRKVRDNRIRSLIFALRGQAGHHDEEDFGEEDEDECCNWCHEPLTSRHYVLECDLCGDGDTFCHSVCLREHILSAHPGTYIPSPGQSPSESAEVVDSLVRQAKEAGRKRNRSYQMKEQIRKGRERRMRLRTRKRTRTWMEEGEKKDEDEGEAVEMDAEGR